MKDKKKIIICAVVAVLVVVGIVVGVLLVKRNGDEPEKKTTTLAATEVPSTQEEEDEITELSTEKTIITVPEVSLKVQASSDAIKVDGGVGKGIVTYKGTDYVATEDGIFAVTASGKKKLTSQAAGNYLAVIDDKIYYSAESKTEKEYIDGFDETIDWQLYDGWVMNLDGSGQKKLIEFIGDGFIIYADDNAIYYAESPGPGIYTCGIGYNIYKLDLKTGEKTLIDDGTVISEDEDGNKDIWKESVDNIIYYDDCIYFRHYTCDGGYVRAAKYNIKTGKKTEITDSCQQMYLAKNGNIYLVVGEKKYDDDHSFSYYACFATYSQQNNKVNKIKKFEEYDVTFLNSDAKNVYLTAVDYQAEKTALAYYNAQDGYKEFFTKNSMDMTPLKYDSAKEMLVCIGNANDKTVIKEICNGKEKVIEEVDNEVYFLPQVGNYCLLVGIYMTENDDDLTENHFEKEELILLK